MEVIKKIKNDNIELELFSKNCESTIGVVKNIVIKRDLYRSRFEHLEVEVEFMVNNHKVIATGYMSIDELDVNQEIVVYYNKNNVKDILFSIEGVKSNIFFIYFFKFMIFSMLFYILKLSYNLIF